MQSVLEISSVWDDYDGKDNVAKGMRISKWSYCCTHSQFAAESEPDVDIDLTTTSKAAQLKPEKKRKAPYSPQLNRKPAKRSRAISSPRPQTRLRQEFLLSQPHHLRSLHSKPLKGPMESPALSPPASVPMVLPLPDSTPMTLLPPPDSTPMVLPPPDSIPTRCLLL